MTWRMIVNVEAPSAELGVNVVEMRDCLLGSSPRLFDPIPPMRSYY
jgi:hypothetical protein